MSVDKPFARWGAWTKGRADRWDFEIMREGHGQHAIYRQANLLAHVGWADSDSDGEADGYTAHEPGSGTSTFTFASGAQSIEADELSGIYYDLVLPFQSAALSLTLSVLIESLHSASSSYSLRLQWLNFAGTALQSSVATPTSTGRQSVIATGNAGLTAPYTLRVWPMLMPTSIASVLCRGLTLRLRLGRGYELRTSMMCSFTYSATTYTYMVDSVSITPSVTGRQERLISGDHGHGYTGYTVRYRDHGRVRAGRSK